MSKLYFFKLVCLGEINNEVKAKFFYFDKNPLNFLAGYRTKSRPG